MTIIQCTVLGVHPLASTGATPILPVPTGATPILPVSTGTGPVAVCIVPFTFYLVRDYC